MTKKLMVPQWRQSVTVLTGTVIAVVVVTALYWAQLLFIPLALAIFLAFLLNPLVRALERRGLGQAVSVVIVSVAMVLLMGVLTWVVFRQVTSLLNELPGYTANITKKVKSLREAGSGPDGLDKLVKEVGGELNGRPSARETEPFAPTPGQTPASGLVTVKKPVPVVVQPESPPWLSRLPHVVESAAESFGGLALALVLVVFMLFGRADLRNRFIRLVGRRQLSVTTKAVDEACQRISRYLVRQALVNVCFGVLVGVGLFVIGVDYAPLWGLLTIVLRYLPYFGPWIAAVFPLTMSLAQFEGWWQLLAVFSLFLVLDLVTNNIIEPWYYGQGMGVSGIALLIAAAFWAFLWGPVGLVLAAPLTVVLVVLGKYVPQLGFLKVLLGDEPTLSPRLSYYQRLLARDEDEATELALAAVRTAPPDQVYDELLVPALNYVKRDRHRGEVAEDDEPFVIAATHKTLADLARLRLESAAAAAADSPNGADAVPVTRTLVLGCPARDDADELALSMLRELLDPVRWEVEVVSADLLGAETVSKAGEENPAVLCIGALPPGGLRRTRYLCKRLRKRFPKLKIVVGRWGLNGNLGENRDLLRAAGADEMTTSLVETRDKLYAWLPVLSQKQPPAPIIPQTAMTKRKRRTNR